MEPSHEQNPQEISTSPVVNPTTEKSKPNWYLFVRSNPMIVVLVLGIVLIIGGIGILGIRSNQPKNQNVSSYTPHTLQLKPSVTPKPTQTTTAKEIQVSANNPIVLGMCATASARDNVVTHCVNLQYPQQKNPSRAIYVVISSTKDSPQAEVRIIASEVSNVVCGSVENCVISIYDETKAADLDYKTDSLNASQREQYLKTHSNESDVSEMIDHHIADYSPPNDFTYLFLPTPTNAPTPTDTSTPTPVPTDVNGFPMDAEPVTVAQIAKIPSAYMDKNLVFTCHITSFVKDYKGDADGFNCSDPNDFSSVIQVSALLFDFTQINQNDTVRIFGDGVSVGTGKNIFGAEVTEALVDGLGINDLTSGYKD
jgi:hypothetical protein